ncbi:glycosyltransferase family 4 protein [Belnapia moabensis]|uniref:glycosyltransferase family 4 protein n=1 Tax=Belnapia moabensis TaxID=365533 RepID=UPI000693BC27|nr:glycosyltransferase family 4 protein [Belnapia moabensis]
MSGRCLLVCHTFPPVIGGSAGVYEALARHAGGAIAVLTSQLDPATGREWEGWRETDAVAPYSVRRIGLVRPPLRSGAARNFLWRQAGWGLRALRLAAAVTAEARRHAAEAVCICDDEAVGWLVPFVRHGLGRRALVYCHGDDLMEEDPAARRARRRWLLAADCVVAAGGFPARQLFTNYGLPTERVAVVPNGVDLDRFRPRPPDPQLRRRFGLEERRVILTPARLVPRKGVDRLIAALPTIRARCPEAILLVVGDGPQRAALEAMAIPAGGPAAVRFAGAVAAAELPGFYALAELVALPNRAEPGESDGTPLVFLEANACGRPVIGGRAGGTPEVVIDGVNGLLVEGEDSAAIAAAVLRVLQDAVLAARLSAGGLEAARVAGWTSRTAAFLRLCHPSMAGDGPAPA